MNIMNIVHWYFSTNKNNKCLAVMSSVLIELHGSRVSKG